MRYLLVLMMAVCLVGCFGDCPECPECEECEPCPEPTATPDPPTGTISQSDPFDCPPSFANVKWCPTSSDINCIYNTGETWTDRGGTQHTKCVYNYLIED
jgi:hypothetical protein